MKVNEGEVPQYYVGNSHPAIISPEVYDLVQSELMRRKDSGRHLSGTGCFAGKVLCGECGGVFGSKVWHSISKYRRIIWRCNQKFDNAQKCQTPHLYEADLMHAFVKAMNSLLENKDALIPEFTSIVQGLMDNTALDDEHTKLQDEADVILGLMHKCMEEDALMALDQEDFEWRYSSLLERLDNTKQRLSRITEQKLERIARRESITNFLRTLQQNDTCIPEFDESLWNALAESVTVYAGKKLVFRLRNGMRLPLLV